MSEVLSPVASRFESGATLTHASAKAALAAGLQRIAAGATDVDCAPLTQFDSSALAVLLAWQRAAQARGAALRDRQSAALASPVSRKPTASIRSSRRDIDAA